MFDLSAKRELNNGFGNALSTAVELAVTPAIFAGIGWQIDRWLGTFPLVFLFLFAFTIGYVSWKQYKGYNAAMQARSRRCSGPVAPRAPPEAPRDRRRPDGPRAPAPEVERELAVDMLRRGVWAVPGILIVATLIWGTKGASSAAVGIGLVAVNLMLAAAGPVLGRQALLQHAHGHVPARLRRPHGPGHRRAVHRAQRRLGRHEGRSASS